MAVLTTKKTLLPAATYYTTVKVEAFRFMCFN